MNRDLLDEAYVDAQAIVTAALHAGDVADHRGGDDVDTQPTARTLLRLIAAYQHPAELAVGFAVHLLGFIRGVQVASPGDLTVGQHWSAYCLANERMRSNKELGE